MYQNLNTVFGYALVENLTTGATWYGDQFMLSAPAVKISEGTAESFKLNFEKKLNKEKSRIDLAIKKIDEKMSKSNEKNLKKSLKISKTYLYEYKKLVDEVKIDHVMSKLIIKAN